MPIAGLWHGPKRSELMGSLPARRAAQAEEICRILQPLSGNTSRTITHIDWIIGDKCALCREAIVPLTAENILQHGQKHVDELGEEGKAFAVVFAIRMSQDPRDFTVAANTVQEFFGFDPGDVAASRAFWTRLREAHRA